MGWRTFVLGSPVWMRRPLFGWKVIKVSIRQRIGDRKTPFPQRRNASRTTPLLLRSHRQQNNLRRVIVIGIIPRNPAPSSPPLHLPCPKTSSPHQRPCPQLPTPKFFPC